MKIKKKNYMIVKSIKEKVYKNQIKNINSNSILV